jgi:opacity protein-like surface antigen
VVKSIGLIAFLLLPAALFAQNAQSAVGGESSLWAGGEVSSFNPDFSCGSKWPLGCTHEIYGVTALVDFNVRRKWGAEGEARWLHWHGYGGQIESNYLIGPRYQAYRIGRFSIWGKFLLGGGWITTPYYPVDDSVKGSYFVYAPGATFDYRLSRRLSVRADYEYQFWPSFATGPTYTSTGVPVDHDHGLTPNGVSVGVTYRFLGQ